MLAVGCWFMFERSVCVYDISQQLIIITIHLLPNMNDNIDPKLIKTYQIQKKVGKGAYGQVWRCLNKKTKKQCALKRIFDAFHNVTDCQRTYREIMYLRELSHPNIVKLYGYEKGSNQRDMYVELEFVESDLAAVLKGEYLKDVQREYIFAQIVSAVYYLHSGNLIHRDIKPSNILITPNSQAKLCDFGLIRSLPTNNPNSPEQTKLTDNIATRWYKAPQLLLSSCSYGKEIDLWSLGCLLGELYLGRPVFQGSSLFNQLEKIIQVTGIPDIGGLEGIIRSQTSIVVLRSFINDKPDHSITKKESSSSLNLSTGKSKSTSSLAQHQSPQSLPQNYSKLLQLIPSLQPPSTSPLSFLSTPNPNPTPNTHILDLLTKLLQFDPRKRIKIEEVLEHPYLGRWRGKVEVRKIGRPLRIRWDDVRLTVEEYRGLLGHGAKSGVEGCGEGKREGKRVTPDKNSRSTERTKQQNKPTTTYSPCQSPKSIKAIQTPKPPLEPNPEGKKEQGQSYWAKRSNAFQDWQIKNREEIPTTYISIPVYEESSHSQNNNINVNVNGRERSEKSVSGNKSISGVSNKSYKSNLSGISNVSTNRLSRNYGNANGNSPTPSGTNPTNPNITLRNKSKSHTTTPPPPLQPQPSPLPQPQPNPNLFSPPPPTKQIFNYRESIEKKLMYIDQVRQNYQISHPPPPLDKQDSQANSISSVNSGSTEQSGQGQGGDGRLGARYSVRQAGQYGGYQAGLVYTQNNNYNTSQPQPTTYPRTLQSQNIPQPQPQYIPQQYNPYPPSSPTQYSQPVQYQYHFPSSSSNFNFNQLPSTSTSMSPSISSPTSKTSINPGFGYPVAGNFGGRGNQGWHM